MSDVTRNRWFPVILVVGFVVGVCLIGPWWSAYELDTDEGLNLQKALLLTEGYALYSEIWSDQPPILTWILAGVQEAFPYSLPAARITILAFAMLLLLSFYRLVERYHGPRAALVAGLLLVTTEIFVQYSVSVMVGLPAIALAVLAMGMASGRRAGTGAWAIAAGAIFALALLTKIFVLIMLPPILLAIWMDCPASGAERWRCFARTSLLFLLGAVAAALIVALGAPDAAEQLIAPHLSARSVEVFEALGGPGKLFDVVTDKTALPYHFAVLFGLLAILHRPSGPLLVPVLWIVSGVAVLANHRPLWSHQVLILAMPLCWIGAVGATDLLRRGERLALIDRVLDGDNRRARGILLGVGALLLVGAMFEVVATARETYANARRNFREPANLQEQLAMMRLQLFETDDADIVVADMPMDPYHLGKTVPPELAVWSRKRWETGHLSEAEVEAAVQEYPEAQVLIRRFDISPEGYASIAGARPAVMALTDNFPEVPLLHFASTASILHRSEKFEPLREVMRRMGMYRPETRDSSAAAGLTAAGIGLEPALHLGSCFLEVSIAENDLPLLIDAATMAQTLAYQGRKGGWTRGAAAEGSEIDDATFRAIAGFADRLGARLDELSVERPAFLEELRGGAKASIGDAGNQAELPFHPDCGVGTLLEVLGSSEEALAH